MFNITMNLNIILCCTSLLFGLIYSKAIPSSYETDPIIKYINHEIRYPCGGTANLAKNNCNGTIADSTDVLYFTNLTENLQERVEKAQMKYITAFSSICGHDEYMDMAGDNIANGNFCQIPLIQAELDLSQSSQNMLLVTKWLFWLKEVEEKRYQQNSMHDFRQSFYSLANYSKSNLCYQEDNFCITQSDVDEVVNCTLPAIEDESDPISIIPESCYVLQELIQFPTILKRSVKIDKTHQKPSTENKVKDVLPY